MREKIVPSNRYCYLKQSFTLVWAFIVQIFESKLCKTPILLRIFIISEDPSNYHEFWRLEIMLC